jgi:hypothetical protein
VSNLKKIQEGTGIPVEEQCTRVRKNGISLEHSSKELKENRDFVLEVCCVSPSTFDDVNSQCQNDIKQRVQKHENDPKLAKLVDYLQTLDEPPPPPLIRGLRD